jgi:hypothetical protein
MKIALDWDDTFTRDPVLWARFVVNARERGHDIRIVTYRQKEHIDDILYELDAFKLTVAVMATGHVQKRLFCEQHDWMPDVWIDDSPEFIVKDYYVPGMELAKTL